MLEPDLPDRACALFFDFDGTLVDLAAQPDAVRVEPAVKHSLAALSLAVGGAVAIVSGRPLSEIDHHLQPLTLCAAGVHGAERRGADGTVTRLASPAGLDEAAAVVEALRLRHPALLLERKPGAIALHYRQAPERESLCLATMSAALARVDGMALLHGKMVIEMKPRMAGKGLAVHAFMHEAPFQSRRPWFFGDDITDEAAFDAVTTLGGVAVKVGEGETRALHRLADPAAMRQWLTRLAAHLRVSQATAGLT